jgi:NitT/TauT family transport system permease protein
VAIVVVFLAAWQLASGPLVKPLWISSLSEIFALTVEWIVEGSLWPHVRVTLSEIVIGFVIGAVAGIVVGIILGSLPTVEHILSPLIVGLYATDNLGAMPAWTT